MLTAYTARNVVNVNGYFVINLGGERCLQIRVSHHVNFVPCKLGAKVFSASV
jgi:hypothetical protein